MSSSENGNYIFLCSNKGIFWIYDVLFNYKQIKTGELISIIDLIDICNYPNESGISIFIQKKIIFVFHIYQYHMMKIMLYLQHIIIVYYLIYIIIQEMHIHKYIHHQINYIHNSQKIQLKKEKMKKVYF